MMKVFNFLLVLVFFSGCATAPAYLNSKFPLLGEDYISALQQIETIARNSAIVYDPSITDEEFNAWVQKHNYNYRRFDALVNLYYALAPEPDTDAVNKYTNSVSQSESVLRGIVNERSSGS